MIDIKIYGTQTSNFEYLKYVILSNAANASIDVNLQEEQSIEAFIRENIESVPAVRISNKLYELTPGTRINEFSLMIVGKLFELAGLSEEKQVVVPESYNKTTANALEYAMEIAKSMKAAVKIVNFREGTPLPAMGHFNVGFLDHLVLRGSLDEKLAEISSDENTKMLVLGKSLLSDKSSQAFGSLLAKLVNIVRAPLLMVPSKFRFKGIKKIMYAVDEDSITHENNQFVHDLASIFNAEVHIVHVEKLSKKDEDPGANWFEYNHFIQNEVKFTEEVVYGQSVFDELDKYANTHNIDIVILSRTKRNLMENLFHKSVTKRMVMKSQFPTIILAD